MWKRARAGSHARGSRVLVSFLAVVSAVYLLASVPEDDLGFVYDGTTVLEVDPGGAADRAGMRVGDVVVADSTDSRHLDDDHALFVYGRDLGAALGTGEACFEVERDHRQLLLLVAAEGPTLESSIRQVRSALPNLPIAVTFFALAFLFVRRARRDHPARERFAVGLALCGSYFALHASFSWSPPLRELWAIAPSLSVLGYMLIAQGVWELCASRVVHKTTGALGAGFAIAIQLDTHGWIAPLPFHNLLQWLGHVAMFVAIAAGMAVLWRRTDEPAARGAVRSMFVLAVIGVAVPAGVAAGWVFATMSVGSAHVLLWQMHMLVPIAISATAARAGLVELDGRLPAVVLYALSLGVAWVMYSGLTTLADLAFTGPMSTEAARTVSFAMVITAVEPVRALVRRGLDHAFARDRMLLIMRCTRLCAELAGIEDRAAIELAVRNVLHAQSARVCELSGLVDRHDGVLGKQLAAAGSLRAFELDDEHTRDALKAANVDTLAYIPGDTRVLALALPLAPPAWDRAERQAVASVGQVIGSVMQQHAAQQALEARVARDEAERRGIAMELHDGLGATLTAARLMTQMVRRAGAGPAASDTLDGLETTLQGGLRDLRIALWGLDKDVLTWGELVSNLRRQLADVCTAASLSLELESELPDDVRMGPAVGFTLHRILQEALTNTVKHARATRIRCCVRPAERGLRLVFADDGIGLPSPVPPGRGLGNMRRRIAALGGTLELSCPADGGTRVDIWLPAQSHDHAIDAASTVQHG
jgi:two-component system sensor histidine kinase UhpB